MAKILLAAMSTTVAFEASQFDDGLSLLQVRAQKHEDVEDPKYFLQGRNTVCEPDEILTYAQCVEAQKKQIVPNPHQAWAIFHNQRGHGRQPSGCFMNNPPGQQMYYNDEPVGGPHRNIAPICGKNGGRTAEIAAGLVGSCQDDTCTTPAGHHVLTWGPNLVIPEISILARGAVCPEACGLLSYAQCQKAGDMGLIEAFTGAPVLHEQMNWIDGVGRVPGSAPSGCSVQVAGGQSHLAFNPYDTVDGALAELTTPTGVGQGHRNHSPVCAKVCTTTTTTPAAVIEDVGDDVGEDDAAAVGDPHLSAASGEHKDLCCAGGHCRPCAE